jgi:hypothetical protein
LEVETEIAPSEGFLGRGGRVTDPFTVFALLMLAIEGRADIVVGGSGKKLRVLMEGTEEGGIDDGMEGRVGTGLMLASRASG